MNLLHFSLRALLRDWRVGELRLIALALVIAVASLTSVSFFTDRVKQATELHATELLAADLVLYSSAPIRDDIITEASQNQLLSTRTTSFRSMVVAGDKLQMAEVKAIEDGYPIRGQLRYSNSLFGQEVISREIPGPGQAWVDARLLQILGLEIGDRVSLGSSSFQISKVLTYEPDRGGDVFNIAPRLLMNLTDLAATELILPGSRVQYRLLLGGETNAVTAFRQQIEQQNYDNLKVQGIRDARPELKTALERAEQFLGLAALISVALAGLAVAMSSQRYAVRHFDNCAIMRCLGTEQGTIIRIYAMQLLILAGVSSLIGSGIGYLAQHGLATLMSGLTQGELPAPSLFPFLIGLLAGLVTVCGFALPQLMRLKNVSPMRVLRRDLTPLPMRSISIYLIAILALALLTPWQSGHIKLTVYTFVGLIGTAMVLAVSARLLIRLINRLRSRVGVASRYGLANIARRASQSTAQIVGIGLGIMVMLLLTLVRTDLLDHWQQRLPVGTPNYFLINIQPDEVSALKNFLMHEGDLFTDFYPMIRGRLIRINDSDVGPDDYEDDRAKRLVSREFNLSRVTHMPPDNRLVSGRWWGQQETQALFSVEEGIAETLGIRLNDRLTYNVAGREVTATVANLRWVEWDSFNVNFFVVSDPNTLADYPSTFISSFYLAAAKRSLLTDILRRFPSITIFDVDAILSQVRRIMEQVVRTVEFVFGFTLLAGIVVLLSALQTTHDERYHEAALLNALGANRRQIFMSLLTEFLCIGLITGLLAAFMASVVEWLLAQYVFQMTISINPWIWPIATLLSVTTIIIGGLAGTRQVLKTPPMAALRKV